jgi:two-component system NtrC family sensor kinase
MTDGPRRKAQAPARGPSGKAGASLESFASTWSGERAEGPATPVAALTELVTLLARASDTDSGAIAALVALRRATGARDIRVELQYEGALRTVWSDRGSRVVHVGNEETHSIPLVSAGEALGQLLVDSPQPLGDDAMALCQAAADLLAIAASRDLRMRHLELEVRAQVRQVAEQRLFMERIVDSMPFGLYVIDREYRIFAWNHRREMGLLGVSRDDAIGRTIFEVLSRQPADLLKSEFDEVFSTGRMQQFQMESASTGETRTFRISKIPMLLDDGSVSHVITVGEDITDWKAALDRIAQSEKLAALGQLAAGVMHEINNPLATIAACAESLALDVDGRPDTSDAAASAGAATRNWVRIIDLEVQRCKKIVDGLLDFSRPKPATRTLVDINECVRQALFLLQHHPRFKRVIVDIHIDAAPLYVSGDSDQLIQVVIALAMNAFDATPAGKHVTFRTTRAVSPNGAAVARVEVEDEGPGVSRAIAAKIFEPFFTTKPQGQGTGLGLSICYGIVADHGGTFELVQPDVPGATFRIELALMNAQEQDVAG